MKEVIQSLMLFVFMWSTSFVADADPISQTLESHFQHSPDIHFLSYEKVEQSKPDAFGSYRYLVMDFQTTPNNPSIQSSIHSICSTVLNDLQLIRKLSNEGYDMISVSFDRQSQYDCL